MYINKAVTFRGVFEEENFSAPLMMNDRFPGIEVAKIIRDNLTDIVVSEVEDAEPNFIFRCKVNERNIEVVVNIQTPDDFRNPRWMLVCESSLTFWEKLRRINEDEEIAYIVDRVHSILSGRDNISDIRWYKDWDDAITIDMDSAVSPRDYPQKRFEEN